jgi:hypothetical protein
MDRDLAVSMMALSSTCHQWRGAHAKEFAVLSIHPILVVFDPVLALNALISEMSFGEILGSNTAGHIVNVDVGRHLRISCAA